MMKTIGLFLCCVMGCFGEEKFVELFNGKDFEGWGAKGKTEFKGYLVKDGAIVSTPKCRMLATDQEYGDYVLEFEFQLTPAANNGLGIHYAGQGDPAYKGMELQVLDNTAKKWAKLKDYQYHGSLYGLVPAKRGFLKPVGEWNKEVVTVKGPKVKVELNGTVIMEANLDDLVSKLEKSHKHREGAQRRKGKICFCGHGDIVSYRNIRIKEFKKVEEKKVGGATSEKT